MKFAKSIRIPAFLALSILLLGVPAMGKNQVIEIDHSPFVLDLNGISMPLHIQQNMAEGDIFIKGQVADRLEISIEDLDDEQLGPKAFLVINSSNGSISLSLSGEFLQRDTEWIVPESTSFSVQTVEGDITMENIRGDINCASVEGTIELINVNGKISVASQDGDIAVQISRLVSGNPISLTSEDGDIALALPAEPDVSLNASTIDGSIYCDFPIRTVSHPDPKNHDRSVWTSILSENTLIGRIGDGKLPIQLNTLDGDIAIVRSNQK